MAVRAVAIVAVAIGMVLPQQALAAGDFYAQEGGTGTCASPADACSLSTAVNFAGTTPGGANVHVIGPLTQNTPLTLDSTYPIHLIGSGSGPGGTLIDAGTATSLALGNGSTADNLHARSATTNWTVLLEYGSSITNSLIENTSPSGTALNASFGLPAPALVKSCTLIGGRFAATVGNGNSAMTFVLQDSSLTAPTGVDHTGGVPASMLLQRNTINASTSGVNWTANSEATVGISSNVIHMTGAGSIGASAGQIGDGGSLSLAGNTIDGSDTTGASSGIRIGYGGSSPIVATVTGSIVRGFATDLLADVVGTPTGVINVARSDFATAAGQVNDGGGNVNADPLFLNRAAGDYRLNAGSPLIDAGGTDPIGSQESATDRAGTARLFDGNGDGIAARDMGALEFVPTPAGGSPSGTNKAAQGSKASFKLRGSTLRVSRGALSVPATCDAAATSTCSIRVVVQTASRIAQPSAKRKRKILTLGRGSKRLAPGKSGSVRVKLNRTARKLLRKGKLKRVRVRATLGGASTSAKPLRKVYRLKRR